MIMKQKFPGREWEYICCYDPFTMGGTAIASVISSGASLLGAMQSSNAQAASAAYQAQVARNNQIISNENAEISEEIGRIHEQQQRQKTASLIGSQRSALAAAGLDANSGSPLDLQSDSSKLGELNAQTIKHNSDIEAFGYRAQADNFAAQAELSNAQSSFDSASGMINLLGTTVSNLASFSNKWYQSKNLM